MPEPKQPEKLIDEKGLRIDGRRLDQLRPIKLEVGILDKADGSAYIEQGKNKILAAVYGPREAHPKHIALPERAVIRCRYHMAPFSVDERKSPAPSRREMELSKVIRESLEPVVLTELYPRTMIDLFVEIDAEDKYGEADLPVALVPNSSMITLLQMDGSLTPSEFERGLGMAVEACKAIHSMQREALKKKYHEIKEVVEEKEESEVIA
ncbi:exosome complex exonuclease Rrp41 [Candidatus Bathyarchaeota archaeon]|nr:MAG: exosome complex exonuclease Rrp41 [Candidatus Bathyarchaeota archaeon]